MVFGVRASLNWVAGKTLDDYNEGAIVIVKD